MHIFHRSFVYMYVCFKANFVNRQHIFIPVDGGVVLLRADTTTDKARYVCQFTHCVLPRVRKASRLLI